MNNFILSSLLLLITLNMVQMSQESHACHVSYTQGPGGEWYKHLMTVVNGEKHEEKIKMSSAEAEKAIKDQHKKINLSFKKTHESIADSIKKTMGKFSFDF